MAHYVFTSNARSEGGLYTLDSTRGRITRLLKGSYRGLTRGPDGAFYTVSGQRNPKKDSSIVLRIDAQTWEPREIASYPLRDSHDLKWIDGHFYLVASVGNFILKLDSQGRELGRLQIVEDPRDICHVNCLLQLGGSLHCTVFTLSPGDRQAKRHTGAWHTEGKLLRIDFTQGSFEIVYESLCQPHSLVDRTDGLYLIESHNSSVIQLDLERKVASRKFQYYGFLRGLAFGHEEIILGVCLYYQADRRRMRPLPRLRQFQERYFPFSGILVLDSRWRIRRRIPLRFSEIYDILPLA